jgi:hypothetical protein
MLCVLKLQTSGFYEWFTDRGAVASAVRFVHYLIIGTTDKEWFQFYLVNAEL